MRCALIGAAVAVLLVSGCGGEDPYRDYPDQRSADCARLVDAFALGDTADGDNYAEVAAEVRSLAADMEEWSLAAAAELYADHLELLHGSGDDSTPLALSEALVDRCAADLEAR